MKKSAWLLFIIVSHYQPAVNTTKTLRAASENPTSYWAVEAAKERAAVPPSSAVLYFLSFD